MILPPHTKDKLKKNWGDRASSLDCYAEIRLYDPISSWQCYIFALDDEEKSVHCIISSRQMGVDILTLEIYVLSAMYNEHGEGVQIDHEFRRTKIATLLKRLKI